MQGTTKWFNDKTGYGFITDENGKDYFVHYTGINSNEKFKKLKEGQKVSFDPSTNEKGDIAINVTVTE